MLELQNNQPKHLVVFQTKIYIKNYFPYNFNFFDLPEPTCTISA